MATIVLRSATPGGLTNNQVDANFTNLNNDKQETADCVATNTANKVVKRDANGDFETRIVRPNNISEKEVASSISGGTLTLDLATAAVFEVTLNANITTLTLSNVQTAGNVTSFVLITVGNGNTYSVTWPASFKWPAATAPDLTSTNGKKDVFVFFTVDGGTSWQAFISGQDI